MSFVDNYAAWVNELAGEYVEDWVGRIIAEDVEKRMKEKDQRIAELERQLAELAKVADDVASSLIYDAHRGYTINGEYQAKRLKDAL